MPHPTTQFVSEKGSSRHGRNAISAVAAIFDYWSINCENGAALVRCFRGVFWRPQVSRSVGERGVGVEYESDGV